MHNIQKFILFVLLIVAAALISGCESVSTQETMAVNEQQEQYALAQPVPYFDYSLERDVVRQLYEARNTRVRTWTVWRSAYGLVEGDCPSIGYPIPYGVSMTSPDKRVYEGAVISQAEPNGLFTNGVTTSSTWVRCIFEVNGELIEAPQYVESVVTAYAVPITVDYETNRVEIVVGEMPTVQLETK